MKIRDLLTTLLLCCANLSAQQNPLSGVIDFHAHVGPDSLPRSVDAVDLARLAQKEGMRAIVIKNHFVETATAAYFARKAVPGMDVFGGIDLNLTVGGMNPAAVENMAKIAGHYRPGRLDDLIRLAGTGALRQEKSPFCGRFP